MTDPLIVQGPAGYACDITNTMASAIRVEIVDGASGMVVDVWLAPGAQTGITVGTVAPTITIHDADPLFAGLQLVADKTDAA